jgi:hypothetical protein
MRTTRTRASFLARARRHSRLTATRSYTRSTSLVTAPPTRRAGVQGSWPCTPLRATPYDLRTGCGPMRRCMHFREEDHGALIGAVGVSVGVSRHAHGSAGHEAPDVAWASTCHRESSSPTRRERCRTQATSRRLPVRTNGRSGCSPVFQGCGRMPPIPQVNMAVGDHAAAVGAHRRSRRPAVPRLRGSPPLVRKCCPTSTPSLRRHDERKRYKHPIDMRVVASKTAIWPQVGVIDQTFCCERSELSQVRIVALEARDIRFPTSRWPRRLRRNTHRPAAVEAARECLAAGDRSQHRLPPHVGRARARGGARSADRRHRRTERPRDRTPGRPMRSTQRARRLRGTHSPLAPFVPRRIPDASSSPSASDAHRRLGSRRGGPAGQVGASAAGARAEHEEILARR